MFFFHFRILEHIEGCRKKIEMELKELQKLCRWERVESYCSLEKSRRSRLKLRKLIKKYSVSDKQSLQRAFICFPVLCYLR